MSSNVKEAIEERCTKLGMVLNSQLCGNNDVEFKTKGELFKDSKNWQNARSGIQRNARQVFFSTIQNINVVFVVMINTLKLLILNLLLSLMMIHQYLKSIP